MTNQVTTPSVKRKHGQVVKSPDQKRAKQQWRSFVSSMLLHIGLLVLMAWLWAPYRSGTGANQNRQVGIAIVHEASGDSEYFVEAGALGNAGQEDAAAQAISNISSERLASAVEAISTQTQTSMTLDSLLGEFASIDGSTLQGEANAGAANGGTSSVGKNGLGSTGLGNSGVGSGKGNGGATKTQVFGIEGSGNSFVYVFDRSDSMNGHGGAPFRAAKRELLKSLETLQSVNQFQVIFYNEAPSPYTGSLSGTRRLIYATDTERQSAFDYVRGIHAVGGTEHVPALRMGASMNADVLFFLTDAADPVLSDGQINDIVERCTSRRTTIHSIEFGSGASPGAGRWIEQLATATGGKYRYVDVAAME